MVVLTVLALLFGVAALMLGFQLLRWRAELFLLARQLSDLPKNSNQELHCSVRARPFVALCGALDVQLEASRQNMADTRRAQRNLQYAIASVSHDIRTPLTGAAGYLQLAQTCSDPQKRTGYLEVVRGRLHDLEGLLDELFLYTRLNGEDSPLACAPTEVYPALCDALAGFFETFDAKGIQPVLRFPQEELRVQATPEALRRVLRNLVSNALQHGLGDLTITQKGCCLHFENRVPEPALLQPEHLFDRFYRADDARHGTGAGLGLAIVRQLVEKMGGTAEASLQGDLLCITLTFLPE